MSNPDPAIDVAKLAALARIAVTPEERETLAREIPAILAFVEDIHEAGGSVRTDIGEHYNVFREDSDPHESGAYTQALVDAMPESERGYLRVRKILSQD